MERKVLNLKLIVKGKVDAVGIDMHNQKGGQLSPCGKCGEHRTGFSEGVQGH